MNFTQQQIGELKKFLGVQKNKIEYQKKLLSNIQKFSSVFRYIPGVLLIGVGNSVAMNTVHKDSDIDVFVITQKNTLWFVRVLMNIIVMLTGNRKTQKKHAGKICLSFFCTEEALDFSNIAIKNDIYLYYRILTMKPILVRGNIYADFLEKNSWVDVEKFQDVHKHHAEYLKYNLPKPAEANIFVKYIDTLFKKILKPRSVKKYEKLGKPEGVIINDTMLKFHDKDRREHIRENVLEKI